MRIVNGKKFMEEGDPCPTCHLRTHGKRMRVTVNNRGRNFRFECATCNNKFTIEGELYLKTKTLRSGQKCPKCGYPSGLVGSKKSGLFCHECDTKFKPDGT